MTLMPQKKDRAACGALQESRNRSPMGCSLQFLMCHKELGPKLHANSLNAIPKAKSLTVYAA